MAHQKHTMIFAFYATTFSSGLSFGCARLTRLCDPVFSAGFTASVMTITLIFNKIFNNVYGKGEEGHSYGLHVAYNKHINKSKYGLENRFFRLMVPLGVALASIGNKWATAKECAIAFTIYYFTRNIFQIVKKSGEAWVASNVSVGRVLKSIFK